MANASGIGMVILRIKCSFEGYALLPSGPLFLYNRTFQRELT